MGATKSQPLWLNNPSKLVKRVKYEYPESSIKSRNEYKSKPTSKPTSKPICSRIKNLFCKKVD